MKKNSKKVEVKKVVVPTKSAFNPITRERDMLKQAEEDGSHGAKGFQKSEWPFQ